MAEGETVVAIGDTFSEKKGSEAAKTKSEETRSAAAAIAVMDIGGVDERLHQQALGIDQDVALLPLTFLPASKLDGSMRRPPPRL